MHPRSQQLVREAWAAGFADGLAKAAARSRPVSRLLRLHPSWDHSARYAKQLELEWAAKELPKPPAPPPPTPSLPANPRRRKLTPAEMMARLLGERLDD